MSSTKAIATHTKEMDSTQRTNKHTNPELPTIVAPTHASSLPATFTSSDHSSDHHSTPAVVQVQSNDIETENDTRGEKVTERSIWLTPHSTEYQKREWYHSSLGMGKKQVPDAWGFSSAAASRSHSPRNEE
jgi:hypothetical protein